MRTLLTLTLITSAALLRAAAPAGYELVWSEEFDYEGAPDPAKWGYDLGGGGWGNMEYQDYTDARENSRVEDGKLIIEVHQVDLGGRTPGYTSARLVTREKASWKYGRVEVRAKVPMETGTWSAAWMLAENQVYGSAYWPDNGEIDIMEHVGYREDPAYLAGSNRPHENILGTVHTFANHAGNAKGGETLVPDAVSEFHTYSITWTEDKIVWEVDGQAYFSYEKMILRDPSTQWQVWPYDEPFHLILNVAVGGTLGGLYNQEFFADSPYVDGVKHEGTWPQRMEVDYVRVYAEATTWKGYPLDANGNADTGSWLGMVNINNAPWIYSYVLETYLYMPDAGDNAFSSGDQWLYFPQ